MNVVDRNEESTSRGRPRSEAARCAVLQAAAELLDERGLRQMTVDELAQRSGVSKATIYKWWPNKAQVALDAFLEDTEAAIPVPVSESAADDLRQQLAAALTFYSGPKGQIYRQFVAEAQTDPEFGRHFIDRFLARRRDSVRSVWERGVANGEFRADVDVSLALDLIYAPMIFRLLIGDPPLHPSLAGALTDVALTGLANAK